MTEFLVASFVVISIVLVLNVFVTSALVLQVHELRTGRRRLRATSLGPPTGTAIDGHFVQAMDDISQILFVSPGCSVCEVALEAASTVNNTLIVTRSQDEADHIAQSFPGTVILSAPEVFQRWDVLATPLLVVVDDGTVVGSSVENVVGTLTAKGRG